MDINKVNLKQDRSAAMLSLLTACASVFLTALDQTVVVTALPQIITDLQIPVVQLDRAAWIVSGYLLGYVIAMPLMGRVSDMYGRRRILFICLGIFALGSLFCGLAPILGNTIDVSFLQNFGLDVDSPGLIWLVAARFVQAAGGGAVVPPHRGRVAHLNLAFHPTRCPSKRAHRSTRRPLTGRLARLPQPRPIPGSSTDHNRNICNICNICNKCDKPAYTKQSLASGSRAHLPGLLHRPGNLQRTPQQLAHRRTLDLQAPIFLSNSTGQPPRGGSADHSHGGYPYLYRNGTGTPANR